MPINRLLLLTCSAVSICAQTASAVPAATVDFHIDSQPVPAALRAFSEQSGLRLLYPYDTVAALQSPLVIGRMTPTAALDMVIAATPLKVAMADSKVIALSTTRPRKIAGSAGMGMQLASAEDAAAAVAVAAPAEAAPSAPAPSDDGGSELIVTGTRAIGRTVANSLAPIDVLSASELTKTSGKQSVRDLLGALVPSINVSNSGAGASFAVKTLSLRGLASDQVLILVNGKRRHNTATLFINGTTQNGQSPADLDLIPASAIDRIEVLRDGASAQYGSDALAGVINLILKKSPEGGTASLLGGQTGDGDGLTGQVLGDFGIKLGEGGYLHLSADARLQDRTDRGGPNTSVLYPLVAGKPDPREAGANRYVNHPGQPRVAVGNVSYDAGIGIGSAVKLYSFGTASTRQSDAWLTFRNPNASNNILAIFPDGYVPQLHVKDRDYQVAAGLKSDGADLPFDWDISTTYAENQVKYNETTALNVSLGPASPTSFYIGKVTAREWTSNIDLKKQFSFGLAEPLLAAIGGEYRKNWYAIGAGELASYVDGGYRSPAGQLFAGVARVSGSQGVTGFPPSVAGEFSRHSVGAYANLEQTIVKGLDVALAGRFEDYSDAGKTTTGKASIRVEPIEGIAFRGTASTGFRAPTLQQQHYGSSSTIGVTVAGVVVLLPVQALPVDSRAAIALGASPLKPEKSTNYSAGVVLTPLSRLIVTIDAYQIAIKDRILLSGTLSGPSVNAALAAAGITTAASGFYFSNAADTRTRGLDIVSTYRASLGDFGDATFSLSGNLNKTKFTHIDLPPAALAAAGLVLIDRARQGDFTKGTPRSKVIGNINWERGALSFNIRATRYGKVTQVSNVPANDDSIAPKVIFDAEIGVKVTDGIRVALGSNNLFNIYPTVLKAANQGLTGFSYYNPYSPYGISGGFYYAKMSMNF